MKGRSFASPSSDSRLCRGRQPTFSHGTRRAARAKQCTSEATNAHRLRKLGPSLESHEPVLGKHIVVCRRRCAAARQGTAAEVSANAAERAHATAQRSVRTIGAQLLGNLGQVRAAHDAYRAGLRGAWRAQRRKSAHSAGRRVSSQQPRRQARLPQLLQKGKHLGFRLLLAPASARGRHVRRVSLRRVVLCRTDDGHSRARTPPCRVGGCSTKQHAPYAAP